MIVLVCNKVSESNDLRSTLLSLEVQIKELTDVGPQL